MSKKTLLKEATIRRFMKLASIGPLAEPFVEKINEMGPYARDVEMEPEEEPLPGEELPGEEPPLPGDDAPLPGAEELPGDEPTGLDLSPEQAEEVAEKLAQGFAGVVEDALGVEGLLNVSTEGEELPGEELPVEEPPLEPPMEEPPMEEPPDDELEAPLAEKEESDEDPLEETEDPDDDSIDKITEKVTAALYEKLQNQKNEKNKKKQYIDNLAERVVSRIFSSTKNK